MMRILQKLGLAFFLAGFVIFIMTLKAGHYELTQRAIEASGLKKHHKIAVTSVNHDMLNVQYESNVEFIKGLDKLFKDAKLIQDINAKERLPYGVAEWDYRLSDSDIKYYRYELTRAAQTGGLIVESTRWIFMTFGLMIMGALLYILPKRKELPGIKNNHIYIRAMQSRGWLGILTGTFLIGFYILLYWYPEYITSWIHLADPLSKMLNGEPAGQWFLYGMLYTICMLVMGIRMLIKYRNNNYQKIRTASVMFFQTSFAFLIPEILVRLNQPYFDFKNMWPLKYDFFFEWNLNTLLNNGQLGLFMLGWGIALFVLGVPVFTYLFGKRWYCSWVCGCGGLAETLGDPFRQLSDKRLVAWKIERWLIHGVLVFAVLMTGLVLYTFFTGRSEIGPLNSYDIRKWYGFGIGSVFAGVVGTGFYPLMGNRVWCRFGCPLAAYLGLIQRFKSRFRITVNGGQCISCGNCSTYCEMGIDVRAYAQKGQDIVRSSCVGCGVCSAVCPRGVLKLENGSADVSKRTQQLRTIHISAGDVRVLN